MRGVKDFVTNNLAAMIDYIVVVSNPVPDQYVTLPVAGALDPRDRTHIYDSLHERLPTLPLLYRESVPLLPHLLDVPKHLATLASAVVRSTQRPTTAGGMANGRETAREPEVKRLVDLAMQVETAALHAVGRLAPKPKLSIATPQTPPGSGSGGRRPSSSGTVSSRRPGSAQRAPNSAGPTQTRFSANEVMHITAQTVPNGGLRRTRAGGFPEDESDESAPTSPTVFFTRKGLDADENEAEREREKERERERSERQAAPPTRPRMRRPNTAPSATGSTPSPFSQQQQEPAQNTSSRPIAGRKVSIDLTEPIRDREPRARLNSATTSRPPTAPTPGGTVRAFGRSESDLLQTPRSPNGARYDSARFGRREAGIYGGANGNGFEREDPRSHARVDSGGGTGIPVAGEAKRKGFLRGLLGGSRR